MIPHMTDYKFLFIEAQRKILQAIVKPVNLQIFFALRDQSMTSKEVAEFSRRTQAQTCNRMQLLKNCGLVIAERTGKCITWSITKNKFLLEIICLIENESIKPI